jgi:hypothetical protein
MRQAILITAYKNETQIYDIINYFGKDFEFYIHVDKKSLMNLSESYNGWDNIHIYKEYTINWGSISHLKAILLLSEKALGDKKNGYFHLITGQDFPTKAKNYFSNELNTEKDYLDYFEMPEKCWGADGGMDRIEYYNLYEYFNYMKFIGNIFIRIFLKMQRILKIKRKITICKYFKKLYGGSTYWSLTRNSLQYVLSFTNKNPAVLESMKFTFSAEEIYFQTILVNSEYTENIVNDNLRFIDWDSGNGDSPAFLDETYYEKIKGSNKIFARKFHETNSNRLKKLFL